MKKALVIGIDDYPTSPLACCVNDAIGIGTTLEVNGDGSPNFSVKILTSNQTTVTTAVVHEALGELFAGEAETALLYFAGHGIIDQVTNSGYIVTHDGKKPTWGISLSEILDMANRAYPKIRSTVIILDCCHSGYAGEVAGLGQTAFSAIGNGVTILTASNREQFAQEGSDHGLFTEIFLDSLRGASADICGRITPASVYAHVDQVLGPWEQRPMYKANVSTFITLRTVSPKVPLEVLRRLPEYFSTPGYSFPLDPSFEPDRQNIPEALRDLPVNEENQRVFKELQLCNRHGLVVPVDAEHMYYAAIESKSCKLTGLGAHYRKLALNKKI